jgi:hypothetical protein
MSSNRDVSRLTGTAFIGKQIVMTIRWGMKARETTGRMGIHTEGCLAWNVHPANTGSITSLLRERETPERRGLQGMERIYEKKARARWIFPCKDLFHSAVIIIINIGDGMDDADQSLKEILYQMVHFSYRTVKSPRKRTIAKFCNSD